MLGVLGVLVDQNPSVSFNCETGVDPQHRRCLGSGLLKLAQLPPGGRQIKMRPLQTGPARCAFAKETHRLPVALEHVMGQTHGIRKGKYGWLKRIETDVWLQYLNRSCGFARHGQCRGVSMVDEI